MISYLFDLPSAVFLVVVSVGLMILWRMHVADDWFDLRDIIAERNGSAKVVSTSKSLLVAAFVMSAYWITKHYSDLALGAFLTAWVANGGIVAWRKTKQETEKKDAAT